ncbi:hypothetical protein [Candidatus Sororendozoicomonas aggregata]|uniref:hypothetical protein n=1 Tax=Candidatus Sororendozoicomonas aggregata TaxID=3073239 RepID=UPI002ED1DCA7
MDNVQPYIKEEWHLELQRVCKKLSNRQVGKRLDCSASLVSQVLHGKYLASRIDAFRDKFRGAFMGYCVQCPVVGELARDKCLGFQQRDFCATNPTRVQLYHACRGGCEHSRIPLEEVF